MSIEYCDKNMCKVQKNCLSTVKNTILGFVRMSSRPKEKVKRQGPSFVLKHVTEHSSWGHRTPSLLCATLASGRTHETAEPATLVYAGALRVQTPWSTHLEMKSTYCHALSGRTCRREDAVAVPTRRLSRHIKLFLFFKAGITITATSECYLQ